MKNGMGCKGLLKLLLVLHMPIEAKRERHFETLVRVTSKCRASSSAIQSAFGIGAALDVTAVLYGYRFS